ncbi:MAG: T9SS type A sorting domain-containing protein, partial [Bacteroidota bacterium]
VLYLLGYYGNDPFGLGIKSLYKYSEPIKSFSSSVKMGDQSTSKTSMQAICTLKDLPAAVRNLLPVTPDSVRLNMVSKRVDEVDAWGTMLMPGGFFEVLREKRSEARNLRIETKIGSLPWQDITDLLPPNDVFGEHVFLSYYFYSEETKEPLVQIYMQADNKGIAEVIYRANQTDEALVQATDEVKPGVYAFPNPAIVNVRFEFANLNRGKYRLSIQNVLGVEVWHKDYIVDQNFIDLVDVSFLSKGTYLYSLQDSDGNFLMTRRIVIIRP